jgi:hypothetical protein
MRKTKLLLGLAVAAALGVFAGTARAATTADVLFVVDESGSMAGEHAWIAAMVTSLDAALGTAGVTGNQYGLVGFGSVHAGGYYQQGHKHAVGGGDWGNAAQMSTAAGTLTASGGFEDGYQAIDYALNNYAFRAGAALNVILITDEDRDITPGVSLSAASILSALQAKNALLNAVVDNAFGSDAGAALGRTTTEAYVADGSGGFTVAGSPTTGAGFGTTATDYVDLATATGGAAWNLNDLRAGGQTAASFTAAFVDIKVAEIIVQPPTGTPDGGSTLVLLGAALAGFAALRRKF